MEIRMMIAYPWLHENGDAAISLIPSATTTMKETRKAETLRSFGWFSRYFLLAFKLAKLLLCSVFRPCSSKVQSLYLVCHIHITKADNVSQISKQIHKCIYIMSLISETIREKGPILVCLFLSILKTLSK